MISSSIRNLKNKGRCLILSLLFTAFILTGCEGPSTAVLPNASATEDTEPVRLSAIVPQSSAERLYQTVNTLCTGEDESEESGDGYDAAVDPAVYIVSVLRNSSYDVNQSGEIVEAILRSTNNDPDICLVIACYGNAFGCASDTAAGAAAALEMAEVLSGFSGDTEIHFIFLPGERSDVEHIYTYLDDISAIDHNRLVGAIIMGGLGLNEAAENELCCIDQEETFLAEQINRVSDADLGRKCVCRAGEAGVQNALLRNHIPSVIYAQRENAEAGTVLDCPSVIDYEYLQQSVDILSRTLALLLGEDTPSMQARAHYTDEPLIAGKEIFAWEEGEVLPFRKSEKTLEALTGSMGEQIAENMINNGSDLSGYRFYMKWFGADDVLPTDFYYLSDSLQSVQIDTADTDLDLDKMHDEITVFYGESTENSSGPYGITYEWMIPMQRLHITLQPQKEGYELSLTEYDTPVTVYPSNSLGCSRLEGLFEQVIPEKDRLSISFEAYTDGYGATLARSVSDLSPAGNRRWVFGLDLDDALDKSAIFRDKTQTVCELVRLYGEYLAEAYASEYYNGYHSRFGGDTADFASSFCLFSLAGEPAQEAGPAADPVRYFYDFDELISFRDTVRNIR